MSLETLQERLSALQSTTAQLRDLIDRLANLPFEPGALPLSIEEEGSPSSELSAEISSVLRGGMEDQQLLLEEAKYVRPEGGEKARLREGIERAGGELFGCRSALRKARLCAKQNLERARRLERELMIQSFIEPTTTEDDVAKEQHHQESAPTTISPPRKLPTPRHGRATTSKTITPSSHLSEKDRQTVHASSTLTTALQRTHALMTSELTRSEFAHQMLSESSEALSRLDESYASLDGMLASSRDLLGALLRSQKSDTWYLQTARYVLLGTLAWLVFRRLLYGPLWWLVWLPLRIVFGVGMRAGSAVVSRGGESGERQGHEHGYGKSRAAVDGLPDESLPTAEVGGDDGEDLLEAVVTLAVENQTGDGSTLVKADAATEPEGFQEGEGEEQVEASTRLRDEL